MQTCSNIPLLTKLVDVPVLVVLVGSEFLNVCHTFNGLAMAAAEVDAHEAFLSLSVFFSVFVCVCVCCLIVRALPIGTSAEQTAA